MPKTLPICFMLLAPALIAEDWPEFRGPTGQGLSTERGIALKWTDTENVCWKVPVPGRGWSSPAIRGNRIWLTTSLDSGHSLRALGFDRETGRLLHNVEVFRISNTGPLNGKNNHASPTPILEDDRVYLHFGSLGTAALTGSGEILWKNQSLKYEPQHGPGGSPAIYKDLLIVSCDGFDTQFVAAIDKRTGKVRWKTSRKGSQAYTTPLVIQTGGRTQVVSPGAFRASSYDPDTGKEIWSVSYGDGFSNVPRPVFGHGLVFVCSGFFQPVLLAVRPDGKGDITGTHVEWSVKRGAPLTSSPILAGDELYMVSDNGIATCLDAKTGEVRWQQRLNGNYSASPVYADGRIYFLNEDGEAVVIAAGREFRKLATNQITGSTLASLAVSEGSIFLRSDTQLYRIAQQCPVK